MNMPTIPISLVERKKYDHKTAHQIAEGIWWIGFLESDNDTSHNPYLLIHQDEAMLINPGSRADEHFRMVRDKVSSLIDPRKIQHIVILHCDPDRCASLPLFEKLADRNVRIYAPSQAAKSIPYYGCKNPVIALDDGDSIILRGGRAVDFYDTPGVPYAGLGFLHDTRTSTLFTGNIFGRLVDSWNLYADLNSWQSLVPHEPEAKGSKKAHILALNKIERLSPDRICPHCGPIIEEDIEKYIAAARRADIGQ